ncbi:MAG: hypothetical protein CW346_05025 [Bacillaceae bacterium]|nr:hypothetical protein [Bacillaceae bacterium]
MPTGRKKAFGPQRGKRATIRRPAEGKSAASGQRTGQKRIGPVRKASGKNQPRKRDGCRSGDEVHPPGNGKPAVPGRPEDPEGSSGR